MTWAPFWLVADPVPLLVCCLLIDPSSSGADAFSSANKKSWGLICLSYQMPIDIDAKRAQATCCRV